MSQPLCPDPLTRGQQRWLEHLRACEAQRCSLKQYAAEHGLSVQGAYVAKSALKRRGAWPVCTPSTSLTLVPVEFSPATRQDAALMRVTLPNGTLIEVFGAAGPEHTATVLAAVMGPGR
jgi:hypothetical protein